jgi:translation initiation factor 3 subunit L
MVDEFIYQFQSFCQYQAKLKQRTDQQLAFLRLFDKVLLLPEGQSLF